MNVYYVSVALAVAIFDPRRVEIQRYVKEHAGVDVFALSDLNMRAGDVDIQGIKLLVANREEIEWPLKVIPPYIVSCGPIIRPTPPIDDELDRWLSRRPTIYINLGTHVVLSLEIALHMATALSYVLDAADEGKHGEKKELQILWKLKKFESPDDDKTISKIFGDHMATGRVRIVEWLTSEPAAIALHDNVAVSVNHGGANSFLEAVAAGKPQIILPAWMDCYDFANRVEFLGLGGWAHKRTTLRVEAADLSAAFVEVLLGPRAAEIKANARRLGALCNEVPGRFAADKAILTEMDHHRS